jgi:tetratricopeptide (TPR) repeat protein
MGPWTYPRRFILLGVVVCALAWTAASRPAAAAGRSLPEEIAVLYDAGSYRQAVEAIGSAVQQEPDNASLHFWMGRCHYELRDYGKAISAFERAITLEPDNSEYHDWLGKAYGRKAQESNRFGPFSAFSLARKTHREFEAAVRLNARNLEAQRDLIRYLLNAPGIVGGGEDAAVNQIHALSDVDAIEGQLAQAEMFVTRKRFPQADEQYQQVLNANPERVGVYLEIAEYYRDRNDGARMERAVEAGARVAPADLRLDYYRGIALILNHQNLAQAEKDLRHYLGTVPNNANVPAHSSAHEWLGKLYEEEGQPDKAVQEYQSALVIDPRDKVASDGLKKLQKK